MLNSLEDFTALLPGPSIKTSTGSKHYCPAHEGHSPALSVSCKDNKILLNCFAGCSTDDILNSLGLTMSDLFLDASAGQQTAKVKQKETGRFFYHDADRNIRYSKVRKEPGQNGHDKDFYFYHGNVSGRGGDAVLYNLPAVVKADTVYIAEGEKCADVIKAWGLCGTTLDTGADSKLSESMIKHLSGKNIIILPDNDKAGRKYRDMLISGLQGKAASIKVVELPDLPEKGDIVDWVAAGGSKEELIQLVSETHEATSENLPSKKKLVCVNLGEFLSMEIPPCDYIIEPIITEQGLVMVYAWRGTGKTYFVLYLIAAIASGSPFLKWTVNKPVGCLFLDGEMPAGDLQLRYQKIIAGLDNEIQMPIKIIPLGLQNEGMPDIGTSEGQEAYEEHITDDIKIIVIDSLTTLARTGRENEGEGWLAVQAWALKLRAQGKTVIFIHHAGKNREQRGTSRREDVLDTVISLKQPGDAKYQDGRFEIHFEKNRNFTGKDAMPIEVTMKEIDTGAMVFTWKTLEVSNYEKVISLYKDGLTSPSDIAEELGINKSNASRHIKKAKSEGLI